MRFDKIYDSTLSITHKLYFRTMPNKYSSLLQCRKLHLQWWTFRLYWPVIVYNEMQIEYFTVMQ